MYFRVTFGDTPFFLASFSSSSSSFFFSDLYIWMGISFGKGSASRTEFHSFIKPAILHMTTNEEVFLRVLLARTDRFVFLKMFLICVSVVSK